MSLKHKYMTSQLTQEDINAQKQLLESHRRTLQVFVQQQAQLGSSFAPPAVTHGIRDARDHIRRIKRTLRAWGVAVEDHPDDGPASETATFSSRSDTEEVSTPMAPVPQRSLSSKVKAFIGAIIVTVIAGVILLSIEYRSGLFPKPPIPEVTPEPSTSNGSSQQMNVDHIIATIAAAPDKATALQKINDFYGGDWWQEWDNRSVIEQRPGFDGTFDPGECTGIAWNVQWPGVPDEKVAIAFQEPQALQFGAGGWYIEVCTAQGVSLTETDAARIQAALMSKEHGEPWDYWPKQ